MIRNDELRHGDSRIQFSSVARESARLQAVVGNARKPMAVGEFALRPYQLNLTGSHLLVAATFALCLASLSVWLVRYLLFAR
jgi:hypothetical protein